MIRCIKTQVTVERDSHGWSQVLAILDWHLASLKYGGDFDAQIRGSAASQYNSLRTSGQ